MSKIKLIQSIGQKVTKKPISQEKERLTRQEGASSKALDPQRSHRIIPRFTSQMAKNKIQGNG